MSKKIFIQYVGKLGFSITDSTQSFPDNFCAVLLEGFGGGYFLKSCNSIMNLAIKEDLTLVFEGTSVAEEFKKFVHPTNIKDFNTRLEKKKIKISEM